MQIFGISYLVFGVRTIKRLLRRQEQRLKDATPQISTDTQFTSVTSDMLMHYRALNGNYNVPKVFPQEYDKYVGAPTMAQMAQWILDLEAEPDTQRLLDSKRVITAAAAIHGARIPKVLFMLDDGTKAFWVRLSFDLELKQISELDVQGNAAIYLAQPEKYPLFERERVLQYQRELPRVGELILQFSEKGAFPSFTTFLRILTGYRDLSREKILTPSAVQSLVTTYAAKSGFKVPASYLCCDILTYQLTTLKAPEFKE
ncbi:hypothetical protein [Burkholderia phage FLC9]|nr:hypothetical protein [Burkholderia phage FLC9]